MKSFWLGEDFWNQPIKAWHLVYTDTSSIPNHFKKTNNQVENGTKLKANTRDIQRIRKCNMLNLFGWAAFSTGKGKLNPQWVTISHIPYWWKFKWRVTPSVGETVEQWTPKPIAIERTCWYGCLGKILALKNKTEHGHISQWLYHRLYDLALQDQALANHQLLDPKAHTHPTQALQSDSPCSIRESSTGTAQEQVSNIWWSLLH